MKLFFNKMENTHSICAGIYFIGGPCVETDSNGGISHLIEHMMFRRWDDIPMKDLYDLFNKYGIDIDGGTNDECISFSGTAFEENVTWLVEMLLKTMNDFDWTQEELEQEKAVVIRQIEAKYVSRFDECAKEKYYRGTPFAKPIMGTEESVLDLSLEEVNSMRRKLFNSNNAALIVTGNYSDDTINRIKALADMHSEGVKVTENNDYKGFLPKNFGHRTYEDDIIMDGNTNEANIIISFDLDLKNGLDETAHALLNGVCGMGMGSSIWWELREKRGWVGDDDGDLVGHRNFTRRTIDLTVESEHLLETLDIIAREILNARELPGKEVISKTINYYTHYPKLQDDPQVLNEHIEAYEFEWGIKAETAEEQVEDAKTITGEMIEKFGSKTLRSNNMSFYVYYDKRELRKRDIKKKILEIRRLLK